LRLATIRDGTRDGRLVIVDRSGTLYTDARSIAPNLQQALDDWEESEPKLAALSKALESGTALTSSALAAEFMAPLPRAFEWVDGSAYLNHIVLVRKARGAEPPETLKTDPLVYQGGSGTFLGPHADIPLANPAWGLDFEAEVCVVLGDVAQGTTATAAANRVRLVMLANDVTLRNLVPAELQKGFGFFQSKPATAFSPEAITPDELGDAWRDGRLHLPLCSYLNDELVGDPDAGSEMHFSFFDLIAHIATTRSFSAGTILGGGTVSNQDPSRGVSCLAEKRARELIETGNTKTPFLSVGDRVRIEMRDVKGGNLFGSIEQRVVNA
jgi:fumarylacetoacetate (FAA) hydrolase